MAAYSNWGDNLTHVAEQARVVKSAIENRSKTMGEFIKTTAENADNTWKETSSVKKACLIGAGTAVLAPLAIIPVLGVVGFTSAGVAAGSMMASMQTATTVSGSIFALCQSAGAVGAVAATTSVGVGLAAGTTAGVVTAAVCKATDRDPSNGQDGDDQGLGNNQPPDVFKEKDEQELPDRAQNIRAAI